MRARVVVGAVLVAGLVGWSLLSGKRPAPPAPAPVTMDAHADHLPRHGGVVLMNADTHFEVVAADHRFQVYFSNAVRQPLPPTTAVSVSLTIIHTEGPANTLAMTIDKSCGCWTVPAPPMTDPNATIRVAYTADAPFFVDVPYSAWTAAP